MINEVKNMTLENKQWNVLEYCDEMKIMKEKIDSIRGATGTVTVEHVLVPLVKKPGILGPLPQAGAPSSGRHEPRSFSSPCNHHVNTFRTIADRQLPPRPTQASPRESHGWNLLYGSNPCWNYPRRHRRAPPPQRRTIQRSATARRGAALPCQRRPK